MNDGTSRKGRESTRGETTRRQSRDGNLYMTDAEYAAARQRGTSTHAALYRIVEILLQVRHEHVATVYGRRNIAGFATISRAGHRTGGLARKIQTVGSHGAPLRATIARPPSTPPSLRSSVRSENCRERPAHERGRSVATINENGF